MEFVLTAVDDGLANAGIAIVATYQEFEFIKVQFSMSSVMQS